MYDIGVRPAARGRHIARQCEGFVNPQVTASQALHREGPVSASCEAHVMLHKSIKRRDASVKPAYCSEKPL